MTIMRIALITAATFIFLSHYEKMIAPNELQKR